jgi:hypothetical protein
LRNSQPGLKAQSWWSEARGQPGNRRPGEPKRDWKGAEEPEENKQDSIELEDSSAVSRVFGIGVGRRLGVERLFPQGEGSSRSLKTLTIVSKMLLAGDAKFE